MTQRHIVRSPLIGNVVALASSAFCDLQVSAFLGSTRANGASGLSRKAGSASKWLTTSYNCLRDAAFSRVISCHVVLVSSRCLAFVQGLESMLKALLQERVLTKVGRLLSCSATLSDNSIESREAVLFRDGLFVQAQADGRLNPECCRHLQAHVDMVVIYYELL